MSDVLRAHHAQMPRVSQYQQRGLLGEMHHRLDADLEFGGEVRPQHLQSKVSTKRMYERC